MIQTPVCILGAGPGGVAAALKLDQLGIPCVLLDKAKFPRDKICGDAISGKVVYGFNRVDKTIFDNFYAADHLKTSCWGVSFFFPKDRKVRITFPYGIQKSELSTTKPSGFVCKRLDFDNYLISFVRKAKKIQFLESTDIQFFEKVEGGYLLKTKDEKLSIKTQLLIAADGAQSQFARKVGNIQKESHHYAGAVRAYYENVKGIDPYNSIELHYLKDYSPGYFWIFPLPNGQANVGFGMRTDHISKRKINLNKTLREILKNHPRIKERFEEAVPVGKIRGFALPLGSKRRKISGDHYMLVGDAASLIDPLTGEGIGNAVVSGWKAAEQAEACIRKNNFSSGFMRQYDRKVYDKLWKELKISHRIQQIFQYPILLNIGASIALRSERFTRLATAMFTDINLRKKLWDPLMYLKLLFQK